MCYFSGFKTLWRLGGLSWSQPGSLPLREASRGCMHSNAWAAAGLDSPFFPQIPSVSDNTLLTSHTSDSWEPGHMHRAFTTHSQAPSSDFVGPSGPLSKDNSNF